MCWAKPAHVRRGLNPSAQKTECNTLKHFGKIQMAVFGLLLVLACVASFVMPVAAQGDQTSSGCFTASATQANRYTVPAGHMAWPGDGRSYGSGVKVWGSAIKVCPTGQTPTDTNTGSGNAGQVCFATSPQYDQVNIPAQGSMPKVSDDANYQRMFELTAHYRNSGPWVMAKAAGLQWSGVLCLQARNPDELSFSGSDGEVHTVVLALQLWGNAWTNYPSAITTGEALYVEPGGRLVKFDEHPSRSDDVSGRACTECAVQGSFSFWPSGAGRVWQLWPDTAECRTEVGVNVPPGGVLPNQSADCH